LGGAIIIPVLFVKAFSSVVDSATIESAEYRIRGAAVVVGELNVEEEMELAPVEE